MDKKLIAILLIALLLRVASVYVDPVKWWDETIYADLGWKLSQNPLDYSFDPFWDRNFGCGECAGFRAPLLPYLLSIIYTIFGDNHFALGMLLPIVGTLGVLGVYLLAKELFDEKTALYAAIFLAILPLHAYFSGKMLTGVLTTTLITFATLFFWLGFVKEKNEYKIACGILAALAFMARYTAILIPPVFFAILILKHRNLNFILDRWVIFSAIAFLLVISPWLLYAQITYGDPLGAFMHAKEGAAYWGGVQSWDFFFIHAPESFSAIALLAVVGIAMLLKDEIFSKRSALLILWFSIILVFGILLPHKEERFLLPLTPALAIFAAFALTRLKNQNLILLATTALVLTILIIGTYTQINNNSNLHTHCFLEANNYLAGIEENAIIFTGSSPEVFFYTHKATAFYGRGLDFQVKVKKLNDRPIYALWSEFEKSEDRRKWMEENNFSKVYSCSLNATHTVIYKRLRDY